MRTTTLSWRFAALAFTTVLLWSSATHAVVFNLLYDGLDDDVLDTGAIVGTGTFSYDGPAVLGGYSLDSLSNFSFSANFGGVTFTDADFTLDNIFSGIFVFDIGGGEFGMVFSGDGANAPFGGSIDAENDSGHFLSHEPTDNIGDAEGCCGLPGSVSNLYFLTNPQGDDLFFGDYLATTSDPSAVPEPATLLLMSLGLVGLRRRRATVAA